MKLKTMNVLLVLSAIIIFGLTSGCGRDRRPDGMPDIYPCSVYVTQENQPLENADVILISDDPGMNSWSIAGKTDAAGKAMLKTHGKFNGAPVGSYTVLISKDELVPEGEAKIVGGEKMTPPMTLYSLVDQKYNAKETSPLKMTVESKKTEQTFEVGKKIKKKVGKDSQLKI